MKLKRKNSLMIRNGGTNNHKKFNVLEFCIRCKQFFIGHGESLAIMKIIILVFWMK